MVTLPSTLLSETVLTDCIQKTSNPFMKDHLGRTPLHLAVCDGPVENIKMLIAAGHPVNIKSRDGFTPLHLAAFLGRTPVLLILLQNGADPGMIKDNGNSALHIASRELRVEPVRTLLEKGLDPLAKNFDRLTPRQLAKTQKHVRASDRYRYDQVSSLLKNAELKKTSLQALILATLDKEEKSATQGQEEESHDDDDDHMFDAPRAKRLRHD